VPDTRPCASRTIDQSNPAISQESWLRSSEQFPRFDKCLSAGVDGLLAA
jgi:hypothetical protein